MIKFANIKILLIFPVLLAVLYLFIPLPDPLFAPDYSTVVLDEEGRLLRVFLNGDQQWCFPPRNLSIPEPLEKAVLCFEDRHFYTHPGANPFSLLRALYQNISSGEIISGASTITMQVARLMRPKERTYFNKALEILQALKIELHYSKQEILSLYLNHAPYGSNIIGYQAASLRYFQKIPEHLTWGEAATLAVLPNTPGLISPLADRDRLRTKRNRLLKALVDEETIDGETYRLALLEPVPNTSKPFRMIAPHLTQFLKDREAGKSATITTTIRQELQQLIEALVKQHVADLKRRGIRNGAALVVETESGKVRGYAGSQDFFETDGQGQVDGVRAARSSGSLLKPFLYALCIDEGIVLPQTLIKDIPSYYGAFSPSNADETFNGLVPVKEALIRSLNVPAVRLLYTYGVYSFYHFLKAAGLTTLFRSADDYGLPLIIGGAEVTLWDMAMLYRGLARGGRFGPLQTLASSTGADTPPAISPGACYLTLNILWELKRPGAEYYWQQYQNQWPLAWKTGTSYGQRDAWAVGVSPQWTIAVWVGNFDGEGNANLTGAGCAGPLLFDIFNALPKNVRQRWLKKPDADLDLTEICPDTGFLVGVNCVKKVRVEAPRHMKPLEICPYHHRIYVTREGTRQTCSLCWQPGDYKRIYRLLYPSDVAQYLRERGHLTGSLPPHKSDCPAQAELLPLQILYPQQNARLWIPRDFDGNRQKLTLRAAHRERSRMLYWYLDGRFLGSSKYRHVKAAALTGGWHTLEVVDEIGNRDRKRFYVGLRKG